MQQIWIDSLDQSKTKYQHKFHDEHSSNYISQWKKQTNLSARYQTNNQKWQGTTQTLEIYADTNI